jgi:hypothetical protein
MNAHGARCKQTGPGRHDLRVENDQVENKQRAKLVACANPISRPPSKLGGTDGLNTRTIC